MPRPIPTFPRGPRRSRPTLPQTLIGCPRVSPEWELSTLAALMRPKPATRGKVEHRGGGQPPWPPDADERVRTIAAAVFDQLGVAWDLHQPLGGEYFVVGQVPAEHDVEGKALAVALSRALPEHWFVLGRLFVRRGQFYRRRRGYRLELVAANDVHLPRALRAQLRGLV